jgi:hypothetical protein
MFRTLILFAAIILCASCSRTFGDLKGIVAEDVQSIELRVLKDSIRVSERMITDKTEIADIINEINDSKEDGMRKGMGWNDLVIPTKDSVIVLKVLDKYVGTKSSGMFFKLKKPEVIFNK